MSPYLEESKAREEALQQHLTMADQRIDDLESQLAATDQARRAEFDNEQSAEQQIAELIRAVEVDDQPQSSLQGHGARRR